MNKFPPLFFVLIGIVLTTGTAATSSRLQLLRGSSKTTVGHYYFHRALIDGDNNTTTTATNDAIIALDENSTTGEDDDEEEDVIVYQNCPPQAPVDGDRCTTFNKQCLYPIIGVVGVSYWGCNCDVRTEQFRCTVRCEGVSCSSETPPPKTTIENESWCPATYPGNTTVCPYAGVTCDYDESMGVNVSYVGNRLNCQCEFQGGRSDSLWSCLGNGIVEEDVSVPEVVVVTPPSTIPVEVVAEDEQPPSVPVAPSTIVVVEEEEETEITTDIEEEEEEIYEIISSLPDPSSCPELYPESLSGCDTSLIGRECGPYPVYGDLDGFIDLQMCECSELPVSEPIFNCIVVDSLQVGTAVQTFSASLKSMVNGPMP